jgi:NAD(P)-dependent dehydrogenase (short-subunit alcohol dehydrogenase family)
MDLKDKVAIITGGNGGIGRAMAHEFLNEGAKGVVISDLDPDQVQHVSNKLGCLGFAADVTKESEVTALVDYAVSHFGQVDLYCSNAGALSKGGLLLDASDELWQSQWEVHVMAHIYAARACLPSMIARGNGYFLITASAAGLLAAMGTGPYTVSKAAAVKLAEFMAITHGDDGIKVSVLCPQGVNTAMAPRSLGDGQTDGVIEPEQLAKTVVDTLNEERFHVLPHPEVEEYVRRKGNDIDRWLAGMRRLRQRSLNKN